MTDSILDRVRELVGRLNMPGARNNQYAASVLCFVRQDLREILAEMEKASVQSRPLSKTGDQ